MATRTFADLSPYRRAVSNAQGTANLLDTILGGVQQGIQLQRLPQTLQAQDIAQQLQNAINQQKLLDLQNPQAALARDIERELTIKGALNGDLGLTNLERGLGTIGTPGAITAAQQATLPSNETLAMRQIAADRGGAPMPEVVIPRAQAGLPLTEVAPFGIPTGVYSDPNARLAAAQRARDAELNQMLAELQAKSQFDVSTAEARAAALEPFEQRKFQREADLKRGLSDTEFTNQMKVLETRHQNALVEGDRDAANRLENDMAVLRENNKAPKPSKPLPKTISERVSDAQSAIDNLITLKSYIDSPSVKSISGPVAGRTFGNNPFSTTAQNFSGVRATAKQVIGKYLEGGVLREADETKYEKIIPGLKTLGDTQDNQIVELYQTLKKKLLRDLDSYQNSGYDVSQLADSVAALDVEFNKGKVSDSSTPAPNGKIRITAPDGTQGLWPADRPIPTGFKATQ